jgi:dTDP-glucose pyrophosphorylase
LLIGRELSMQQAMEQLEKTAQKVLFVVDDGNRMFGSLTDGDIRRWILSGGSIDASVESSCHRTPFFVEEGYDFEQVRASMLERNISCVPVLNQRMEILDLLFWDEVFKGKVHQRAAKTLDIPVVIMAGGKGTRLDPFTKILPKPLIPIGDKTVIEIILDSFLKFGVKHFFISINYKSKIIKSFFEELNPPYTVEFIEEDTPLGTAGSLQFLRDRITEYFILTNCDIIISTDYPALIDFHVKNQCDMTLVASMKNYRIPYGVCVLENGGKLKEIDEKPGYNFLVNTGMYVVNRQTLRHIPEREMFHITHLIEKIKKSGGNIGVFPIRDKAWIDTGEWSEYKKALKQFST